MPPEWNSRTSSFCPVCASVFVYFCVKTLILPIAIIKNHKKLQSEVHIWHTYSTNETLWNCTKDNDLMTLTIIILDFVAAGNVIVSQTHLALCCWGVNYQASGFPSTGVPVTMIDYVSSNDITKWFLSRLGMFTVLQEESEVMLITTPVFHQVWHQLL